MPAYVWRENLKQLLFDSLATCHNDSVNHEWILIDNASPLSIQSCLPNGFVPDVLLRYKFNRGYACAVNDGLKIARGQYLFVLNSDIRVPENWSSPLIDLLNQQEIGVVGPAYGGGPGICAAIWGMRAALKDEIGYLDEEYPLQYEDTDYFWRVKQAGYKLRNVEVKDFWHFGGATSADLPNFSSDRNKSCQHFIDKWGQDALSLPLYED